jgi:CO/xanthine dehydrogenase Mo-binding subunit/aerobic-type carbon monoxide dehydrogenase small subunit (CoxS/CutS family)
VSEIGPLRLRTAVNGQPVALDVAPGTSLAELLRDELGLTGTKVSCGLGICGACTVLVDGHTVSACTTLAADVEGAAVRTVEGLAEDGVLSRLQQAFIRHGALQCGYCTPGFLNAATELLERNPQPDEAAVVAGLDGNICRCTGYRPIVTAVLDAAGTLPAPADPESEPHATGSATGFRVIGTPVPRVDGPAKVTGAAAYTGDLAVPGLLHGAVVGSPVPHGRLDAIDTSEARSLPGVVGVLTAADLLERLPTIRFGPNVRDCPLLAEDVVRYEGEPVALVLATSRSIARRAARLVRVECTDLPRVIDIEAAMAAGSPILHEPREEPAEGRQERVPGWQPESNVAGQFHDQRGDVEAALASADHVFEHEYRVPTVQHVALENQVAIAIPGAGTLTIQASNQYPFLMSGLIGELLGLPETAIRISIPYVGGAFGGREYASILPLTAAATWVTGRAVRLEYSLEESARAVVRHAATMRFTSGVMNDGRIVARKVELRYDTGAYADQGPRVVRLAAYRSPGPYRIPNVQVDAWAVYTNKPSAGAYRGFGANQPVYACERHMDEIAAGLGLDPVELRRQNLLGLGEDFVVGDLPLDCDLPEQLRIAQDVIAAAASPARATDGRARGVGYALGVMNTASGLLPSSAIVRLHADGSVTVLASSVEMGQGTQTALAMVAAETLGLPVDRVRVVSPDTATTPFDQRTAASRSVIHMGTAVERAARDAAGRAVAAAAPILGCPPEALWLADGAIQGGPSALPIGKLIRSPGAGFGGEVVGVGHFIPASPEAPTTLGFRASYWEGSVGAAEVAVDPETGEVEVLRYVTVSDVGRVINPVTAHGQEEGGAVMAFGHALFEASIFEDGVFLNPTLVDYRVPRASDVPRDFTVRTLERGDGPGPFGSKGMGETSIITVAPAIANAVAAATGVQFRDLPLTPWTVWRGRLDGLSRRAP